MNIHNTSTKGALFCHLVESSFMCLYQSKVMKKGRVCIMPKKTEGRREEGRSKEQLHSVQRPLVSSQNG